jgi:hypothetical protein
MAARRVTGVDDRESDWRNWPARPTALGWWDRLLLLVVAAIAIWLFVGLL